MLLSVFNLWRACFEKNLANPGSEECQRGKQFVGCCKGLSHNRILSFTLHSADALWRVPLSRWMLLTALFSKWLSRLCRPHQWCLTVSPGCCSLTYRSCTWRQNQSSNYCILAACHLLEGSLIGTCSLCRCGVTEILRKVWKSNFSIN